MADAARVSTRTLRNYFGSAEELAERLVNYHLAYLENYYTKSRIAASPDRDRQFRTVRAVVRRHKPCYLFTDQAFKTNLSGR